MVEKEVKNIEILKKKEEEEVTKVFLSRTIAGFPRNTLSFNTLN